MPIFRKVGAVHGVYYMLLGRLCYKDISTPPINVGRVMGIPLTYSYLCAWRLSPFIQRRALRQAAKP